MKNAIEYQFRDFMALAGIILKDLDAKGISYDEAAEKGFVKLYPPFPDGNVKFDFYVPKSDKSKN